MRDAPNKADSKKASSTMAAVAVFSFQLCIIASYANAVSKYIERIKCRTIWYLQHRRMHLHSIPTIAGYDIYMPSFQRAKFSKRENKKKASYPLIVSTYNNF